MMGSLFTGATGLKTHSTGLATVSNNLANVNTIGYKQQSILFQDLMSDTLVLGSSWGQTYNQLGMGSAPGDVRTNFTSGSFEPGSSITDLAIGGKGFFKVVGDDGTEHYTRAGNFNFDADGFLRDPAGFTLAGVPMAGGVQSGDPEPIQINFDDADVTTTVFRPTSAMTAVLNIPSRANVTEDSENPYFSLLEAWNGTAQKPLSPSEYASAETFNIFDNTGSPREVTVYFDGVAVGEGQSVYEYVVAANPGEDGSAAAGTAGAGLLMAGTLTFDNAGKLVNMSAFTPNGSDNKDLATWTPAPLVNGLPQFSFTPVGEGGTQAITLDLGVQAQGGWTSAPASAAAVGADGKLLPGVVAAAREGQVSTARPGSGSQLSFYEQNGLGQGVLVDVTITPDGRVRATYSNNSQEDLYSIPLYRFTSEDGLRHEGANHYSATPEAGEVEYGDPGTSNYGTIAAKQLETSNVDMSREFVNMIVMQRGFQMNSKTITTSDTMLQLALQLKR